MALKYIRRLSSAFKMPCLILLSHQDIMLCRPFDNPCVSIAMMKCRASQKKLAALPGGAGRHDGGGAPMPAMDDINQRFLSLFPNMSQAQTGKEIGVNPGTVFKWRKDISQVPWERLKHAVDTKGVIWEWLIEGR